jgi:hypothetical protein
MNKFFIIRFKVLALKKVGSFEKYSFLSFVALFYVFSTQLSFSQQGGEVYNHADLKPFACNAVQYQVTADSKVGVSTLWAYNPMLGTRIKIADLRVYVNAIGFNTKDNLIYGIMANNEVVAIGSDGAIWRRVSSGGAYWSNLTFWHAEDVTRDFFVGDVTDEGYLYIYSGSTNRYYIIDVDHTRAPFGRFVNINGSQISAGSRYATMTLPINIDDWAYNPKNGRFYGVTGSGTGENGIDGNKLVSMPKSGNNNRAQDFGRPKLASEGLSAGDQNNMRNNGGIWGAVFFDNAENLWAASNLSGRFYRVQIDEYNSDGFSQAGAATQYNDGASCPTAAPLSLDYGDAPDSYGTTFSDVSLSAHIVSSNLGIGMLVDKDQNGFPGADAKGDDNDGGDDEDGIGSIYRKNINPGTPFEVPVAVYNTTGAATVLAGWIDWNKNGIFDSNERAQIGVPNNQTLATLTWTVPTGTTVLDNHFLRLRIATSGVQIASPRGLASDGEIEDHLIGLNSPPLPVTLVSLSAQGEENGISLKWQTVTESNFSHFEVQRSTDGKNFAKIGLGNGSNGSYDFTDEAPVKGINYYRLKMIDLDNSYALSRVVSSKFEKNKYYFLVENPAKGGSFTINTNAENPRFELFSLSGKRVALQSENDDSNTAYRIKIKKQIPGLYVIRMTVGDKVSTQKIIVE